ncbi:unnamed protein product [Cuscuta campestris]|uniref:DUF4283 domain-containing protein n=1 Tax=Cuscuta campestris TaxID=132261 RepID=A0A484MED2_9ASTE|nr:unnamed protein product [Cuscuta campestris]
MARCNRRLDLKLIRKAMNRIGFEDSLQLQHLDDYSSKKENPNIPLWVTINRLPLHLLDVGALYQLFFLLGTPLKVDSDTLLHHRFDSAKACVIVDISAPLPSGIHVSLDNKVIVRVPAKPHRREGPGVHGGTPCQKDQEWLVVTKKKNTKPGAYSIPPIHYWKPKPLISQVIPKAKYQAEQDKVLSQRAKSVTLGPLPVTCPLLHNGANPMPIVQGIESTSSPMAMKELQEVRIIFTHTSETAEKKEIHKHEPLPLHNKFSPLSHLCEEHGPLTHRSLDDTQKKGDSSRATSTIINAIGPDEGALEIEDDEEEIPPHYHSEGEKLPSIQDTSRVTSLPVQLDRRIKALAHNNIIPSYGVLTRSQSKIYGVHSHLIPL